MSWCSASRSQSSRRNHYGVEFVKEPFRKHGISYELCKQTKSDLFRDMLPLLNCGNITLPRHDRLIAQIVGLERRVSRAGRDSIDHAPGAHDDIANAVSGVVGAIASGVGNAWINLISGLVRGSWLVTLPNEVRMGGLKHDQLTARGSRGRAHDKSTYPGCESLEGCPTTERRPGGPSARPPKHTCGGYRRRRRVSAADPGD